MQRGALTLRLTDSQQAHVRRETGLRLRSCTIDRGAVLAMLLTVRHLERGHALPFVSSPVVLDLDAAQQREIEAQYGIRIAHWVFDAHDRAARYREDWSELETVAPIGDRCQIAIGDAPADPSRLTIRLLPGGHADVFGTGEHPATRLALAQLEHHLRRDTRVVDVGTGSGILAIAAVRLGATAVHAFDIDPAATARARANVTYNNLDDIVHVREGTLDLPDGSADLVVANLISGEIVALMPDLARVLTPAGILVVSGLVVARENDIVDAARAVRLELLDVERDEPWSALALGNLSP